jgi:hypothetical protein
MVMDNSTAKATAKGTAESKLDSGAAVAMMTTTMAIDQWWIVKYYLAGQSGRSGRVIVYLGYVFLPYFWYR